MKLFFFLPGFHRYARGSEVAVPSVADASARGFASVTVMGSGEARPGAAYRFRSISSIRRERFEHFPTFPPLRSETAWADARSVPGLIAAYSQQDYDALVTCSFPFTH